MRNKVLNENKNLWVFKIIFTKFLLFPFRFLSEVKGCVVGIVVVVVVVAAVAVVDDDGQ